MSLYRIMLVDDEEEVRKAIIRKMDWAGLGFEVVGDAENGEGALEMLLFSFNFLREAMKRSLSSSEMSVLALSKILE